MTAGGDIPQGLGGGLLLCPPFLGEPLFPGRSVSPAASTSPAWRPDGFKSAFLAAEWVMSA